MATTNNWSPQLEGMRGIASLWVFLGHIALLVNCKIPLISVPKLGVDLFILLSGYLMTRNYIERQEKEPWNTLQTMKIFWLRRFFRIAPLYYVMLAVALLSGHFMGEMRQVLGTHFPSTITETSRYSDVSPVNILTHLTFLFGLLPEYAYNTALPDWSIGLEMQYYLAFPFIMLLTQYLGFSRSLVAIMVLTVVARWLLPGLFEAFPMPSMLLIKLHMFIAGMFIARAVILRRPLYAGMALLSPVVSTVMNIRMDGTQIITEALMITGMVWLLWPYQQRGWLQRTSRLPATLLGSRMFTWSGEISYSVYLLHLLIVIPVIAWLLSQYQLSQYSSIVRYLITLAVCLVPVYFLATVMHYLVEKKGIILGKKIILNHVRQQGKRMAELP